jgi:hypothetical protein
MTRTLVRTAIRTCTSIKEGDRKELSSLDVRHAAGAADIASKRHKSWALASAPFDDGGMAGGSLERPALRRHFFRSRCRSHRSIVVHKIDRLTRSLADFARLVDRLDKVGPPLPRQLRSLTLRPRWGG